MLLLEAETSQSIKVIHQIEALPVGFLSMLLLIFYSSSVLYDSSRKDGNGKLGIFSELSPHGAATASAIKPTAILILK